jgi:flagellar basal-body rod modification protein FlgD
MAGAAGGSGGANLQQDAKKQSTAAEAASAAAKASVDYKSFLNLLTAQIKNQDPLAPLDATQFITQLAQFSTVEQAVQSNQRMAEMLEALKASGARLDMAYLGRTVQASSDTLGLKDGAAKAAYAVGEGAKSVKIDVLDEAGKVVRSLPGKTEAGRHEFAWDGLRADGTRASEGTYKLRVTALDDRKKAVAAAVVVTDVVTEVRQSEGESVFVLKGGAQVKGKDILGVS